MPAPITAREVRAKKVWTLQKYLAALERGEKLTPEEFVDLEEVVVPSTYGGNTSCVEVRYGDQIFVLDMGTGLRPLGNSLFGEMLSKKGLEVTFFLSHVHWDHIQGLPFFGPLYMNKKASIKNINPMLIVKILGLQSLLTLSRLVPYMFLVLSCCF